MRRILLIEPSYRTKYPPLGLMKISTYHKLKGDFVCFCKGCSKTLRKEHWDRIYISTLFTYYWSVTLKTINFYKNSVSDPQNIIIGGVMATLLEDEIKEHTNVTIMSGLLDKRGMLDNEDRSKIDLLTPDYSILDTVNHNYQLKDSYLCYATRGCPNRCSFCAVHRIESKFIHYVPFKQQIKVIDDIYGEKQDLILMDNNVLASNRFEQIIADILELGFHRKAKLNNRLRKIDFNQGLDLRLLTPDKMELLAKTAIKPVRLAFDDVAVKDHYIGKIKLARDNGIVHMNNYVLFNYKDKPEDLYERLRINVELNEELETQIYSFPMKFVPLDAKDRSYIGKHWNKRLLRGIQCVLLATRGLVGTKLEFFKAAFGSNFDEFIEILSMPDDYIIFRNKYSNNGANEWKKLYHMLTNNQKNELLSILGDNKTKEIDPNLAKTKRIRTILSHYLRK